MAIKSLGKRHEQLNVAQLKIMVMWFKNPSDSPIPATRQLLLERLHETCCRNEPLEPTVPCLVPLPPQQEESAEQGGQEQEEPAELQLPPHRDESADDADDDATGKDD